MRLAAILLVVILEASSCVGRTTTTTTKNLRGGKVTHTRTVHETTDNDHHEYQNRYLRTEQLVESRVHPREKHLESHHYVEIQGKNQKGGLRKIEIDLDGLEDKLPHNAPIFTKNNHVFRDEVDSSHPKTDDMIHGSDDTAQMKQSFLKKSGVRGETNDQRQAMDTLNQETQQRKNSRSHRSDQNLYHHAGHLRHFDGHAEVERQHDHSYHPHAEHQQPNLTSYKMNLAWENEERHYNLPTGFSFHFNHSLFDELHNAPFVVYEEALGHKLPADESFPVFALPQPIDKRGVFTGFSKHASSLFFENVKFLLNWEDLQEASSAVVPDKLQRHIDNNNFHASLIVGKTLGDRTNVAFTGMAISYYQHGREKNVLVPFSKLEDFFDDSSGKHLMDPATKSLEMDALHEMLEEKRAKHSKYYHPALPFTERRKKELDDLESDQFHKLFQLLIRRAYLFAYGYADCLLNEPERLRLCLDDSFYNLIKMETEIRGALDEVILERLVDINHTFHSQVSEACITTQGSGTGILYGSGSCNSHEDLGIFVSIGGHGITSKIAT